MKANETPEQYISKSALVAEIESKRKYAQNLGDNAINSSMQQFYDGMKQGCVDILSFIDTLEVKEVDLEKELSYDDYIKFFKEHPDISDNWGFDETWLCAKYFFELGLKAKDWEKERMEECPYRQVGCTMYEGTILECNGACSWVVDYPKLKELKARII